MWGGGVGGWGWGVGVVLDPGGGGGGRLGSDFARCVCPKVKDMGPYSASRE